VDPLAFLTVAIAALALGFDVVLWIEVARGHRRWKKAVSRSAEPLTWPRVQVVVCLKGRLPRIAETIRALESQDYPGSYRVTFVTEASAERGDPAAIDLARVIDGARRADHVVAGRVLDTGDRRAQKNHNLLAGLARAEAAPGEVDAYAFHDGDLVARPEWLREMIRPLALRAGEASTSFHDVVAPGERVTAALHALAEASQSFAALVCRDTWGGSMAIRVDAFRRCGLAELWGRTVVDDMAMSRVLRHHRIRVAPVPRFLVSSDTAIPRYDQLVRWLGRQFFFVKVYLPSRWFLLWVRSVVGAAGFGLTAFHWTWRLVEGVWPAGAFAGWTSLIGAAGVFAATASARFFLPVRQPLSTWIPANLLFPGTALLACADAALRRQRITWSDLTYRLDRKGHVAHVEAARTAAEPIPEEAAA
jgi:cellulose synthase/poly-beta-1,6-N-acetylglucosamine synthase-like glycosyltransferase